MVVSFAGHDNVKSGFNLHNDRYHYHYHHYHHHHHNNKRCIVLNATVPSCRYSWRLLLHAQQQPELSDDELAAREAEASMQGHTHNLLNQSVAAGYRSGAKQGAAGSEHGDGEKVCSPW